jgi:hypothetical protein
MNQSKQSCLELWRFATAKHSKGKLTPAISDVDIQVAGGGLLKSKKNTKPTILWKTKPTSRGRFQHRRVVDTEKIAVKITGRN